MKKANDEAKADEPKTDAIATGKKEAYKPQYGGRPANCAQAID